MRLPRDARRFFRNHALCGGVLGVRDLLAPGGGAPVSMLVLMELAAPAVENAREIARRANREESNWAMGGDLVMFKRL